MPLLILQAYWVRFNIVKLPEAQGKRCGYVGDDGDKAKSINLLIIGDSATAGVGVDEQKDALSGRLSTKLSANNNVHWKLVAQAGLTSEELIKEINELQPQQFDYVVVSVGVNDVTHLTSDKNWIKNLHTIFDLLTTKFGHPQILMTALPPMHLFTKIPQPLRAWLGKRAKKLNTVMKVVTAENSHCSLLTIDSPFTSKYLAKDGFHPSKLAYNIWAEQAAKELSL